MEKEDLVIENIKSISSFFGISIAVPEGFDARSHCRGIWEGYQLIAPKFWLGLRTHTENIRKTQPEAVDVIITTTDGNQQELTFDEFERWIEVA